MSSKIEEIGIHNSTQEKCGSEEDGGSVPDGPTPGGSAPGGPAALGTAHPSPDETPLGSSLPPKASLLSAERSPPANAAVVEGIAEVPNTNSTTDLEVHTEEQTVEPKSTVSTNEDLIHDALAPRKPDELQDSALDNVVGGPLTAFENDVKKEPKEDHADLTASPFTLVPSAQQEHNEGQSEENHQYLPLTSDASVPYDNSKNLEATSSLTSSSFFDARICCTVSTSEATKSASVDTYNFDTRDGLWGIFQDIATFTMISEVRFWNAWGWVSGFGIGFFEAPSPPVRGLAHDAGPQVFQLGADEYVTAVRQFRDSTSNPINKCFAYQMRTSNYRVSGIHGGTYPTEQRILHAPEGMVLIGFSGVDDKQARVLRELEPVWGARTGTKWAYVPPIVSIGSAGAPAHSGIFWADLTDIGDYTQRVISSIKLWSGPSGLFIQVLYNRDTVVLPRRGGRWAADNEVLMEFKLSSSEYIVGIDGWHSSTQVNSMEFRTNTGRRSPLHGRKIGTPFSMRAPGGQHILYFCGCSDLFLKHIEAFASPLPPPTYSIQSLTIKPEWETPNKDPTPVFTAEGRNDAAYPKKIEQYLVWEEQDWYQITLNPPQGWPIIQYSFPDIEISRFEPPNNVTFMIRDWRPFFMVNDEEVKKSRWSSETVTASVPGYTKKYKVEVASWQVVFFGSGWEGMCMKREWTSSTESKRVTGSIMGMLGTMKLDVKVTVG